MNKFNLLSVALFILAFALGTSLALQYKPQKCMETYPDFQTAPSSEFLDGFYTIIQAPPHPKPEDYRVRKIGSIIYGEKAHLVMVHYYRSVEDLSFEYARAYNYFPQTKKAEIIEPVGHPETQEFRMYLPHISSVTCGIEALIQYHSCDDCEDGTTENITAFYDPAQGQWKLRGVVFEKVQEEGAPTADSPPSNEP